MEGSLFTTAQPGPAFDDREIGRYHDTDLMALTAIRAHNRGDRQVVLGAILLPGVLDRVVELVEEGAYHLDGLPTKEES